MSDDLSDAYAAGASGRAQYRDTQEMESFLRSARSITEGGQPTIPDAPKPPAQEKEHAVTPKPQRRAADGELGTPAADQKSTLGNVMRNIGEMPKQAVAGVDDAARNVFKLPFMKPLDELANWINTSLPIDTTYEPIAPAKTMTGGFTRKVSEFLTGFIPALKGLRMLGATSTVAPTILASAISDFTVRDPHEGRLSDLWKDAGLPENVLTNYLASAPTDTDAEARMKNAAESVLTGLPLEGIILGARAIRSMRAASRTDKGAAQAEIDYLKSKYGNIPDTTVGDGPLTRVVVEGYEGGESATYTLVPPKGKVKEWSVAYKETYTGERSVEKFKDKAAAQKHLEEIHAQAEAEIKGGDAAPGSVLRGEREGTATAIEKDLDEAYRRVVGDPSKPAIEISVRKPSPAGKKVVQGMEDTAKLAPRALIRGGRGTNMPEDFEVFINFANIDAPEKVKFIIGKMAEALKPHIDEATRGTITLKETEAMADKLGMTVPDLLARRKGAPLNAEEATAARNLWTASAEQLMDLAKKAASPNAGALDAFAFRKQMAVHAAIQSEVLGARTETARALNAWKIEAKGGIERARAIQQVMGAMGGPKEAGEMARRIAILAEVGDPAALARIVDRGWGAKSMDAFKEVWVNGLLSSVKTHGVNTLSNTLVAFQQIYERGAAAGVRSLVGGEGVVAGEATAMAFGLIESVKDAFRMAAKSLKTGESGYAFNKIDSARTNAISSEAFQISKETGMGRFVDFLGSAVNIPGRLLGAEDEFFKTIGYRMELRAQALRTATQEGKTGKELARRIEEITQNPPEHIRINSADAALYTTFTNEMGSFGRAVLNMRNIDHPANPLFLILPFVRTPVNIARYAFERTPFAPLVSQWRADVAAGGARADLALARMSTGTAIMVAAMDLADSGLISGDGPRGQDKEIREAMQRQGWQPFSFNVGDRWYSYNRADPFGMTLGFAASIAEAIKHGEVESDQVDEWWEVSAMAIAAVSQVTISKTYLEGFAKFVEVMSDPKRYSKQYIMDMMASFVPMTSMMTTVKNIDDPIQREASSPQEAVMARIAGLSKDLPPRRNLWGEPITSESGLGKLYDAASPIGSKEKVNSPIDKEIVRLNAGPNKITQNPVFDGVQVNMRFWPKAYDDYVRLSGNDLKHPAWGMGAKDYLNKVVSGEHPMSQVYNIMSDESRKSFIQNAIRDYRGLAQRQILGDPKHAGFAAEVEQLKSMRRDSKMPVLGEQQ